MFNNIIDPRNNKSYSIFSNEGKQLLKSMIIKLKGGAFGWAGPIPFPDWYNPVWMKVLSRDEFNEISYITKKNGPLSQNFVGHGYVSLGLRENWIINLNRPTQNGNNIWVENKTTGESIETSKYSVRQLLCWLLGYAEPFDGNFLYWVQENWSNAKALISGVFPNYFIWDTNNPEKTFLNNI